MSDPDPPERGDIALGLPSAAVLFLVWAFLFYLARMWSKLGKDDLWGTDGSLISLAMVMAIAHVVAVYHACNRGYGEGWMDKSEANDRLAIMKSLYAADIFFVSSLGFTRASTAFFTSRILVQHRRYRLLTSPMIFGCTGSTITGLFVIAIRKPIAEPWLTMNGSKDMFTRWIIIEMIGLMVDLGTLFFATTTVWRLQMPTSKRVVVCVLFTTRLLIVPVVACRLWKLHPSSIPTTYNISGSILTEAELHLLLILASATCLKPLLQPFHSGTHNATNVNLTATGYTNRPKPDSSKHKSAYELTEISSTLSRLRIAAKFDLRDDASDEIDLVQSHHGHANALMMRPDQGESWSKAVAGPEATRVPARNEHSIAATCTWTVTRGDRDSSSSRTRSSM